MQKKFIALAVAGLVSGAAFAQSNVTIYGVADGGFTMWKGADQSHRGIHSGDAFGMQTSRLGFKGEEALGNGLKAIFAFESKVVLDNTSTAWGGNRQAWVGLTSDRMGTLRIGTQSDLTDDYIGGPTEYALNMSVSTLIGQEDGNFSNAKVPGISYKSPVFGGFQVAAGYYAPNEADTPLRQEYYMLGAQYANGPLSVAATYALFNDNVIDDSKAYAASAAYDFKIVKLMAGYYRTNDTGILRNQDNAMWQVGAQVPVGAAGTIGLGYGAKRNDVNDTDTKGYSVAYMHQLSKRTALYAAYAHLKNDDNSSFAPNGGVAFVAGTAATYGGEKFNGLALGMNHKF